MKRERAAAAPPAPGDSAATSKPQKDMTPSRPKAQGAAPAGAPPAAAQPPQQEKPQKSGDKENLVERKQFKKLWSEDPTLNEGPVPYINRPIPLITRLSTQIVVNESHNLKELRVSKSGLVTGLPEWMLGGDAAMEYGDWIITINGDQLNPTMFAEFHKTVGRAVEDTPVTFEYNRLRSSEIIEYNSFIIPQAIETTANDGFQYMLVHLYLFKGCVLDLKLKSYDNKVYVSTSAQTFKSMSRSMMTGDAILSVDGFPISDFKECSSLITNGLIGNKHVVAVIQRPLTPTAQNAVKNALQAIDKKLDKDFPLAEDVNAVCREELTKLRSRPPPKKPSIKIKDAPSSRKSVTFEPKVQEFQVGINPGVDITMLTHAPARGENHKKKGGGGGESKEPPKPAPKKLGDWGLFKGKTPKIALPMLGQKAGGKNDK